MNKKQQYIVHPLSPFGERGAWQFKRRDAETQRKKRCATLCNSVNLRVTLCKEIVTQSYTEKTQRVTEKKNLCVSAPLRLNKIFK
jgi:hypothetical protein